MEDEVLETDEIQGEVFPGFGTGYKVLLGFKIDDSPSSLDWLSSLVGRISSANEVRLHREVRRNHLRATNERSNDIEVMLNLAFSGLGLKKLSIEVDLTDADNVIFTDGMAADASALGDKLNDQGLPKGWDFGYDEQTTPDILLILGGDSIESLKKTVAYLCEDIGQGHEHNGIELIFQEIGSRLPGDAEHFGFRDGISQPGIRGKYNLGDEQPLITRRYVDPEDPLSEFQSRPGQALVYPGQYVFGYASQALGDPRRPGPIKQSPHHWMKNGSFLVLRKLAQDVPLFRAECARFAQELKLSGSVNENFTSEKMQAMLVGRWPKGTPLIVSPDQEDETIAADLERINYFSFGSRAQQDTKVVTPDGKRTIRGQGHAGDKMGLLCPLFAHVRQVNPRDTSHDLEGAASRTLQMQMQRRGIAYGPVYDEADPNSAITPRGLLFMSYQTSLVQQFKKLTENWMNQIGGPHQGGHDLLVGQPPQNSDEREAYVTLKPFGLKKKTIRTKERWVTAKGGGYFFAPSKSAAAGFIAARQPLNLTMDSATGSRMQLWKQDPTITTLGIRAVFIPEKINDGLRNQSIQIVGMPQVVADPNNDFIFSNTVDPKRFDAVHTFAVVYEVLQMYRRAFSKRGLGELHWQWGQTPINVSPHAGFAANAYYSRSERALKFYFFDDATSGERIYTCHSADVVAHETGHAILDAICPNYWPSTSTFPQTGALHESFGDITALLYALSQLDVCEAIIAESKANLHDKKSFFPRISEQFGWARYGENFWLRHADNDLTLSDIAGNEVHKLSNVFTGAIYDILCSVFDKNYQPNKEAPAETLFKTGEYMRGLIIDSFKANLQVNATFQQLANSLLSKAEQKYKDTIKDEFARRGVFDPQLSAEVGGENFTNFSGLSLVGCHGTMNSLEVQNAWWELSQTNLKTCPFRL